MSDACDIGIGAWISQRDAQGHLQPVMVWSRKLSKREQKYVTNEKELMAIVLAIEFFKPYLYGKQFVVMTDHRPLAWLRDHAKPSCLLARWLIKVRGFDFIKFIDGVRNTDLVQHYVANVAFIHHWCWLLVDGGFCRFMHIRDIAYASSCQE